MAAISGKKNFEFRMSKKVAELTQVVHMLFTRNHEKEVELEALKESYEHEIGLVLEDAKSKIEKLDKRMNELEKYKAENEELVELQLQAECLRRETELQTRIKELESQLQEEKTECQNSRDLLIQAQRDLQDLRQGHMDELDKKNRELDIKDRDLVRLRQAVSSLEKEVKDKDSLLDSKGELLRTHEKLRKELDQFRTALQTVEKLKEDISNKNRHLESEVKALKRELAKKSHDRNSAKARVPVANGYPDYNEEIEVLRKEILRYRMELSNRENNFNRVFSGQKPVVVPDGRRSATAHGRPALGRSETMMPTYGAMRVPREKTYAGESLGSSVYSDEEIRDIGSGLSTASSVTMGPRGGVTMNGANERLPQLDSKPRPLRLARPKPLPKDLLSTKGPGH